MIYNKIMKEIFSVLNDNERSADPFSQQLLNVINTLPQRERSDSRDEQMVVLNSLGDNFVQEMTGHIYNVIRNEKIR